mmetsp:Transcript_43901/g.95925  ORF Transcript_43901/g.95925 Transcript_43901/m.95925 type:complete len:124 (-) Transcript_43901:996-1367(-)
MPDVFCSGCGTLLSGLEQVIVHVHMAAASSAFVWSIPSDITYGVICPILKQDHDNAFAALLSSPMKYRASIFVRLIKLNSPLAHRMNKMVLMLDCFLRCLNLHFTNGLQCFKVRLCSIEQGNP